MEGPLTWGKGNDAIYAPLAPQKYPFTGLPQPLSKVLRQELGPGELDAAARACKAWATQLAQDVMHCEMCLPASYELLQCQLEQVIERYKGVHSWKLWLPAGRDWAVLEELNLLWLLSRYNAEKLQLDGLLNRNTKDRDLPTLRADVLSWMPSLRSLKTLTLSHFTLANPSSLRYLSFLPNLTSLTFGITAKTTGESDWSSSGLASILPYLRELQQIVVIEIHVEGSKQLPEALARQVRQVFAGHGKLQRFRLLLGERWGLQKEFESVMLKRVSDQGKQPGLAAAAAFQQHREHMAWLAWSDPSAARAAAAAGLDLSTSDPRGFLSTAGRAQAAAGSSHLLDDVSDDDSFWLLPSTVDSSSGRFARMFAYLKRQQGSALAAVQQAAPDSQQPPANAAAAAAAAHTATAASAAALVPGGTAPQGGTAAADNSSNGNGGGPQIVLTLMFSQSQQEPHQLEYLEVRDADDGMINEADQVAVAPAPATAPAPAPAQALTSAGVRLKRPQVNDCLVTPDSVLVTHLKLIGLTGPAALYHRLQQQLSGSPAIALQDVEFTFDDSYSNLAVVGEGRFWQLLLRQMLLLRGLTVCGLRYCETAVDAPHFWRAVGQLRGLTKLCFEPQRSQRDRASLPDVQEPAAAAAKHELVLDALFMQVLTCRLQGLKTLEFNGEIPAPGAPGYVEYIIKDSAGPQSGLHHSSSGRRVDPRQPPLSYLTLMTNLTSLSLDHVGFPFGKYYGAQLDMAWLPAGLTRLQLANIALSCHGLQRVSSAAAAAGYMALLLQQRRANTPDAIMAAAAAAADAKGKMPVEALQSGAAAAKLGLHGPTGSSISGTTRCIWQQQPPVNLCNLQELKIQGCEGVQAAVIGCLAHSTGLTMLSLSSHGTKPVCVSLAVDDKPEPVSLAAIAWMWPRLQTVDLSTRDTGSSRGVSTAAAAEGGLGESGHKLLPDLLDPSVTPELAAAWLWHLDAPLGCGDGSSSSGSGSSSSGGGRNSSGSGRSSSAAAASVLARLLADICSRGSSSPSWADPEDFAVFAASLPNLTKLNLMLSGHDSCSTKDRARCTCLFRPRHLLGLVRAQSLRELTVTLPTQPEHQAAADIMSLTQLSKLRLLNLTCKIRSARVAGSVSMQFGENAAASAAAADDDTMAAAPLAGDAAATQNTKAEAGASAEIAAAAATAVAADTLASQQAPPAAAAARSGSSNSSNVRPLRPSELLAEMRANMPNTSVILSL